MNCRYAPFSSEGGMLGYLMAGEARNAFTNIEKKLNRKNVICKLNDCPKIINRDYKLSNHKRTVPPGKSYPVEFCCHHLILIIKGEVDSNKF